MTASQTLVTELTTDEVIVTTSGFAITDGQALVEFAGAADKGRVRGTITVSVDGVVRCMDAVTLTAERDRERAIEALDKQGISVRPSTLVALALRVRERPPDAEDADPAPWHSRL